MKLSKEMLRSLILEEMKTVIQEATTYEIGYLNDVLEIPKSELPFSNIFGDRYRILGSFKSDNPGSPFNLFESFVKRTGWALDKDDISQVVSHVRSLFVGSPDAGVQVRTKELRISLVKYFQDLIKYLDDIPEIMKRYSQLVEKLRIYSKEKFGGDGRGWKKEYFKDKEFLKMTREKLSLEGFIQKFVPDKGATYMNMYSSLSRIDWDGDYLKAVENSFSLIGLKKQALKQQKWLIGEKGTGNKNYELFSGVSYDEYKATLSETEYVVFSRHPIDVFRMADHEGLGSCHTIPSSRDELYSSMEDIWDKYNICALTEAHANGMIAYVLNPDSFDDLSNDDGSFEPTQDGLDKFEDRELFSDKERDVQGIKPYVRLRIKNLAYLVNKGDHSEVLTRVAIPEQISYGDDIPGFLEYVNKMLADVQKDRIADINENSGEDPIDLSRFLRVGGSYQDNNVEGSLIDIFNLAADKDLEFDGYTQYSDDLEQSLKETYIGGDPVEEAKAKLTELIGKYNTRSVNFDNLKVSQEWDGGGLFMGGKIFIIWKYEDEIVRFSDEHRVRSKIEEAVDQGRETYFYDQDWFDAPVVMFGKDLGGSKNTMIIQFSINNFSEEHAEGYYPYDPYSWDEALSTISEHIDSIMDPYEPDSFNNYIKHYISFHYPHTVTTDVSGEYAVTRFESALEEDKNWGIDDIRKHEENPLGITMISSFTAKFEDGASLGSTFANLTGDDYDEEYPDGVERARKMSVAIATLISLLESKEMSVLKASLINDAFIANPQLYNHLSVATSINTLRMQVEASIGSSAGSISPEQVFKGIVDDDELNLSITISISDGYWTLADEDVVGLMMMGNFGRNNGWQIDADQVLEKLIGSDLVRLTQQKPKEDLKEFIRKQTRLLLRSR